VCIASATSGASGCFPVKGRWTRTTSPSPSASAASLPPQRGARGAVRRIKEAQAVLALASDVATRTPHFCSGCPHNTSTKVPEGMRAYAGIGCHYMAQWMERGTDGFTQMGGEGANWVGESNFSTRGHVFQNLGDGTYNHSGVLALRWAAHTKTHVTYKILFNDAVAMTGGKPTRARCRST
jgi:indolepyruvate ferredoxin oxidoreductase